MRVLEHPGGPYSSTPLGGRTPSLHTYIILLFCSCLGGWSFGRAKERESNFQGRLLDDADNLFSLICKRHSSFAPFERLGEGERPLDHLLEGLLGVRLAADVVPPHRGHLHTHLPQTHTASTINTHLTQDKTNSRQESYGCKDRRTDRQHAQKEITKVSKKRAG